VALYFYGLWINQGARRRQKVSPRPKEVGSSYTSFHRFPSVLGVHKSPMSCHPAWPGVTCWHCGFQRFSCLIKEWLVGGGGRALAGNIWQHAKTKALCRCSCPDCTANNCGLYVKGIKNINIPKTDHLFSSN